MSDGTADGDENARRGGYVGEEGRGGRVRVGEEGKQGRGQGLLRVTAGDSVSLRTTRSQTKATYR
jgi:hypothetical protein